MAYAGEIEDNLKTLDLAAIANKTLVDNQKVMADLNAVQLSQGLRADGKDIVPSYKALTVELKQNKPGLAGVTDRVTLFDEGDHYRELYAEVQGQEIEYGSRDPKSAKLQEKYGKYGPIYGLTNDSNEELVEQHLRPAFQSLIEEVTGLKYN